MAASTSVGDLCRLCGTDTLNIVRNAIFEGEGRVKKYALKISECLTLQVTQEDRLPKIMCGECTYKLDLISDFRDKAFKTETLLISKLDLDVVKPEIPDEDDGPDLNNDDVGGDDFHSSSPEPPIEPEVVVKEEDHAVEKRPGRKAATKRSMRESESEEEEEEAPAKKRGRKPKETPTATATAPVAAPPKENTGNEHPGKAPLELLRPKILQPMVEVKTEPVDPDVSPPPAVPPPPLPAATGTAIPSTPGKKRGRPPGSANKNSPRKSSTNNPPSPKTSPAPRNLSSTPHEVASPSPSISATSNCKWMRRRKCPECNLVLNNVSDLKKHLMNQHFRCARCDLLFANLTQLQQHACQVPTFRCPVLVCSKKMAAAQVHFHVARWHQGEPVCCVCLVMLDSMQQLEQHHVNMHPGEVSKCPQCGDLVKTGYMKKHVQMKHWKDRPHFGCSECSKTFRSKSGLDAHIQLHTDEHHFACPWCPEDFQLLVQLNCHLERHATAHAHAQ